MQRSLEDVVETIQNAKDRKRSCSLLIGAGCSVKAGIPTAAGFVEQIRVRHPRAYERAEEKTYAKCMAELTSTEQRDLIAEYVDKAKINWAHIAIALLVQHGYVDRVLRPISIRSFPERARSSLSFQPSMTLRLHSC